MKLEEFYVNRKYERVSDKAYCLDCEWKGEKHWQAREHCKESGHRVILEANYDITYEREPNKWLIDHEHRYYPNSRQKSDVCIICGYTPEELLKIQDPPKLNLKENEQNLQKN